MCSVKTKIHCGVLFVFAFQMVEMQDAADGHHWGTVYPKPAVTAHLLPQEVIRPFRREVMLQRQRSYRRQTRRCRSVPRPAVSSKKGGECSGPRRSAVCRCRRWLAKSFAVTMPRRRQLRWRTPTATQMVPKVAQMIRVPSVPSMSHFGCFVRQLGFVWMCLDLIVEDVSSNFVLAGGQICPSWPSWPRWHLQDPGLTLRWCWPLDLLVLGGRIPTLGKLEANKDLRPWWCSLWDRPCCNLGAGAGPEDQNKPRRPRK